MDEAKKVNDGGSAFPRRKILDDMGIVDIYGDTGGMSLRDWFAGQALAGLLAFPGTIEGDETKYGNVTAKVAYEIADAMLKSRSEQSK